MLGIVNRPTRKTVLHDVPVTVRDRYDVARFQIQAAAIIQSHRASPFRQEVVDDHMLRIDSVVAGQPMR